MTVNAGAADQQPAHGKKPWYPTKAAWAEAKAKEARDRAGELRFQSSRGSSSRAAGKYESIRILENEALKFERMARRFRAANA